MDIVDNMVQTGRRDGSARYDREVALLSDGTMIARTRPSGEALFHSGGVTGDSIRDGSESAEMRTYPWSPWGRPFTPATTMRAMPDGGWKKEVCWGRC